MFTAALFTKAKTWKNPLTGESIKKVYIYTMEHYSAIKKSEIMPVATAWMQLEIIVQSEVSKKEILDDITYMWNLK